MAKVLVAGGAGYLGCHTARVFHSVGHDVFSIDDLSSGRFENLKWGRFYQASLNDVAAVKAVMLEEAPDIVVHCAGAPGRAGASGHADVHRAHIGATLVLLEAMIEANVRRIVFASSCETFGAPLRVPITEAHPAAPRDSHAWSVHVSETMVQDIARAHNLAFVILRSFNVVGAAPECPYDGAHPGPLNPLPPMLAALHSHARAFELPGRDHITRDGTLERDLLHVDDVVSAHLLAGNRLLGGGSSLACNLGRGRGVTLSEMLVMVRRISGRPIRVVDTGRRFDDCPRLFADGHLAGRELGWRPKYGFEGAIKSAIEARHRGASSS